MSMFNDSWVGGEGGWTRGRTGTCGGRGLAWGKGGGGGKGDDDDNTTRQHENTPYSSATPHRHEILREDCIFIIILLIN